MIEMSLIDTYYRLSGFYWTIGFDDVFGNLLTYHISLQCQDARCRHPYGHTRIQKNAVPRNLWQFRQP